MDAGVAVVVAAAVSAIPTVWAIVSRRQLREAQAQLRDQRAWDQTESARRCCMEFADAVARYLGSWEEFDLQIGSNPADHGAWDAAFRGLYPLWLQVTTARDAVFGHPGVPAQTRSSADQFKDAVHAMDKAGSDWQRELRAGHPQRAASHHRDYIQRWDAIPAAREAFLESIRTIRADGIQLSAPSA
ncbi:hypothetical protein OG216_19280 [Streptomycetaceae bacterium NBC_01309]